VDTSAVAFSEHVTSILRRFFEQNGRGPLDGAIADDIAGRLWRLVGERGLPRPLLPAERGEPGGMSDAECDPLVRAVLGSETDALFRDAVRQLVKACFYPEFKTCRDSFRAVGEDGECRRQDLARVLRRVSGTHCVDCPHWTALTPAQHERYVARFWRAGEPELRAHRAVYLPEDFRELRRWLHAAARRNAP
jgi:hypothetical protein